MKSKWITELSIVLLWAVTIGTTFVVGKRSVRVLLSNETDLLPKERTNLERSYTDRAGGEMRNRISNIVVRLMKSGSYGERTFTNPNIIRILAPICEFSEAQIEYALRETELIVKDPSSKMMLRTILLSRMAEINASKAWTYLDEHGDSSEGSLRMTVVSTWAQREPAAVLEFYEQLKLEVGGFEKATESGFLQSVFTSIGGRDLDLALQLVQQLDETDRPLGILGLARSTEGTFERQNILEKIQSIDNEMARQVGAEIVAQWVRTEPLSALDWVAALPLDERAELLSPIVGTLVKNNPSQFADRLIKLVNSEERANLYAEITVNWASWDPQAAGLWLSKQEQGIILDQAKMRFAEIIVHEDSERANAWVMSIQSEDIKSIAKERIRVTRDVEQ